MNRQRIRMTLLTASFILFQVFLISNIFWPISVMSEIFQGMIFGSLVLISLLFIISLLFGRAFCGWLCPVGAVNEFCTYFIKRRATNERLSKIKYFLFLNQYLWIIPILSTMLIQIYGLFLLWPIIPSRLGTRKTLFWSIVVMVLISFVSLYTTGILQLPFPELPYFQDFFAFLNWWPMLVIALILLIILIYDIDGLTPTLRSFLAARSWNKGKTEVQERWGSSYSLLPYGKISVDLHSCNGCGVCVDVCPMLIPFADKERRTVLLREPERCVNCRACVNRCPEKALLLAPETEAARKALLKLQGD